MVDARYADVMVEILPAEPEQAVSTQHGKAAIVPDKPRFHPAVSSAVKKRMPDSAHIPTSTSSFPPSGIASTQTVKIPRQVQREGRKGSRNAVRKRLESFKYYPASARRRGIEGDVDVSFKLVHGGTAEQVKVLKGSGYTVLDHAALSTVSRAQPFSVENGLFRFHLRFRRL